MKYVKNTQMEFLEIDNDSLAVYDPDTGDVHYMDDTAKVILSLLDAETEFDSLIDKLCEMYSAERAEIEADVTEFLSELTLKKVVLEL